MAGPGARGQGLVVEFTRELPEWPLMFATAVSKRRVEPEVVGDLDRTRQEEGKS